MPQSKSKSQARFQVAGSPVPVVRADADHPRRPDFEEYDPNAPVGAEEPSSNPGTYEVEDEREEQENERINSNTKISRGTAFVSSFWRFVPYIYFWFRVRW